MRRPSSTAYLFTPTPDPAKPDLDLPNMELNENIKLKEPGVITAPSGDVDC
jgi:hypothetical protein